MKVDAGIGHHLNEIPATVKKLQAAGYDGVRTAEMNHDPFFPLLLAAEHSDKLEIASKVVERETQIFFSESARTIDCGCQEL